MNNLDIEEFFENYVSFDELMNLAKDIPVGSVDQYLNEYPKADAVAKIFEHS